jgi:hypothetical protein
MPEQPIDSEALAKMLNIPSEQALGLIEESQAKMRRLADAWLAKDPEMRKSFEATYASYKTVVERGGKSAIQDLETFVRTQAAHHAMLEQMGAGNKTIKASEVAEAFGGELPPGWDDMLTPGMIDRDLEGS